MLRAKFLAASAILAMAVATQAHAATIIQDGNFNDPLAPGSFVPTSSPFGTGNVWTVTGGSVDLIGNYWQAPTLGGGSVDLDGNAQGGIQQIFNTTEGRYSLQFYLSANPDGGLGTKQVTVSVGGVNQDFFYTLTGANTHGNMGYALETLNFVSLGGPTTLSFQSDTAGSFGGVIGGVEVSAIPEPATWTMLLLGFGAIGWSLRSRRRSDALTA